MAQEARRINSVAPLANVEALSTLIDRVQNRGVGLPGMACFYGHSGHGKTTAATWCANRYKLIQVQVASVWRQKFFCEAVIREMGLKPEGTVAHMVDQIAKGLAETDGALLIDEADHLVKHGLIEIARDIYEKSGSPVILIGEEQMPQKLQQFERVHNRMLDWVRAEPADVADTRHLARIYCPDVLLSDQLIQHVAEVSHGKHRRICVNFDALYEHARTHHLHELGLDQARQVALKTGLPPQARKGQ